MKKLPNTRQNNLVIQQFDRELLVYDLDANKAFSLNETSAMVFNACNGKTTVDELKAKHKFTDDLIYLTLDELKKESLIADNGYQSPFAGMSRRQAAKKVGLATVLALPVIMGVVAPQSIDAQSTSCQSVGQTCSPFFSMGNCCSGSWCGNPTCLPCVPNGIERCFPPGFNCPTIAYTCCTGNIVAGPSVSPACSAFQACFCV